MTVRASTPFTIAVTPASGATNYPLNYPNTAIAMVISSVAGSVDCGALEGLALIRAPA